jgi:putative colanic acid biosynthesis glycosyltransferase
VTRTTGPVVLHFHVLHSYWLNLEEVVAFCEKVQAHKPDTALSGRCTITGA